jgi:uncharacterized protein
MYLWTAFTIGLFGSLHCIGMCGPIAMTVGGQRRHVWANGMLYNLGRTVTYTLIGGVIGLLGQGLFLAGFQKTMSIAIGAALLMIALFSINVETNLLKINFMNQLIFRLKAGIGKWMQRRGFAGTFAVGVLNGFLPCGLVYMAVVGALSTGEIFSGMGYMALFGLGTLPLMTVASLAGNFASLRFRMIFQKIYPAFLIFFAMLFLFRGLNFHIPGEFFFWEEMKDVPMCH